MKLHKASLVFCSLLMLPAIAVAQPKTPATGRWVMDVSKSTFTQAVPKSSEVMLSDDRKVLNWRTKTVSADGKVAESSGKDSYGKTYPSPDGKGSRRFTRISDRIVKRTFKYAGGASLEDTCTIAKNTMTCAGTLVRDGKSTPTKSVYHKAK